MVHEKIGYHPDGTGIGADAGSRQWTGQKRRKHVSGEVRASSSYSPPQRDKEEDPLSTISEADLENIENIIGIKNALMYNCCIYVQTWGEDSILEEQKQRDVYRRLVVYRLRAHKLLKGESDKLDDETLKNEIPEFLGTVSMFRIHIDVGNYFENLKKDEDVPVDWYFDSEFCSLIDLADYQRLVLTNHDDVEYLHWEDYRSDFSTYKMDKDYVAFFDKMSEELQWLKSHIETIGSDQWSDVEIRGANHALLLTTGFSYLTLDLVLCAYKELIWSLNHDYWFREGWDSIFLEIWNLVTKQELNFTAALTEVISMPCVGRHRESILWALQDIRWSDLESNFVSCTKGIPHEAGDKVAGEWIRRVVWELPKKKMLHQYKKRKMEIAESIYLHMDSEGPRMLDKSSIEIPMLSQRLSSPPSQSLLL